MIAAAVCAPASQSASQVASIICPDCSLHKTTSTATSYLPRAPALMHSAGLESRHIRAPRVEPRGCKQNLRSPRPFPLKDFNGKQGFFFPRLLFRVPSDGFQLAARSLQPGRRQSFYRRWWLFVIVRQTAGAPVGFGIPLPDSAAKLATTSAGPQPATQWMSPINLARRIRD